MFGKPTQLVRPEDALPGRTTAVVVPQTHAVTGQSLTPPFAAGSEHAYFAMGCFWGAERRFWQQPGVTSTAVGYLGGFTPNPNYEEVCSGMTGHTEGVLVIFDPQQIDYDALLRVFWESHDPTQGMRQGNDQGTQYRSGLYPIDATQRQRADASREHYQQELNRAGLNSITTEIADFVTFYYAEEYHQQYLQKNPDGYCGLGGTGVTCPVSWRTAE